MQFSKLISYFILLTSKYFSHFFPKKLAIYVPSATQEGLYFMELVDVLCLVANDRSKLEYFNENFTYNFRHK